MIFNDVEFFFFLGVYKSEGNGLTAVAWDPSNEHNVAIGALDGSVILIDTREPNKIISESIAFPRSVHKLNFHPKYIIHIKILLYMYIYI